MRRPRNSSAISPRCRANLQPSARQQEHAGIGEGELDISPPHFGEPLTSGRCEKVVAEAIAFCSETSNLEAEPSYASSGCLSFLDFLSSLQPQ